MNLFVGLDVSQKMTAICVVDGTAQRVWRGGDWHSFVLRSENGQVRGWKRGRAVHDVVGVSGWGVDAYAGD